MVERRIGLQKRALRVDLVSRRLDIEIGAGHHGDSRRCSPGSAGDKNCLGVGRGGGDAEDQAKDRDSAIFHSEDDGGWRSGSGWNLKVA